MNAAWSEETRQRLFQSARGLTCLFWAILTAGAGFWAADAERMNPLAFAAVETLFVIPLGLGLWVLSAAMAGMRRSTGFGAFAALSLAVAGLTPFGAFWRLHPDVAYFAWNALGLCAAWTAWLSAACWLVRRYARDLGDRTLATEAAMAGAMIPAFGVGVAVLLSVALARAGTVWTPKTMLLAFGAMAGHARLVTGFPFLVTAYTLWLAKESGYRRLMGG